MIQPWNEEGISPRVVQLFPELSMGTTHPNNSSIGQILSHSSINYASLSNEQIKQDPVTGSTFFFIRTWCGSEKLSLEVPPKVCNRIEGRKLQIWSRYSQKRRLIPLFFFPTDLLNIASFSSFAIHMLYHFLLLLLYLQEYLSHSKLYYSLDVFLPYIYPWLNHGNCSRKDQERKREREWVQWIAYQIKGRERNQEP